MQLIPATAPADFVTQITDTMATNSGAIVGVAFVAIVVTLVLRLFRKWSRLKG